MTMGIPEEVYILSLQFRYFGLGLFVGAGGVAAYLGARQRSKYACDVCISSSYPGLAQEHYKMPYMASLAFIACRNGKQVEAFHRNYASK